jgi:hypothetical protein
LAVLYLIQVGRFGYISGTEAAFSATSSLPQIAVSLAFGMTLGAMILLSNALRGGPAHRVVLGSIAFAATGTVGLLGGTKEAVLVTIFAAAATVRLAYGRLPKALIVGGVAIALLLFAFVNPYRESVRYEEVSIERALQAAGRGVAETVNDPARLAGSTIGTAFDRLRDIDSVAVIVSETPSVHGFRDVLDLPIEIGAILTPRSLWPSKPPVSDGRDFAIQYLGYPETTDTAIAVTLVGDSYRYGGLLAAIVVGLLLGAYIAALDRALSPIKNPAALVFVVALVLDLGQAGNGIAVTAASQLKTAVVAYIMAVVLIRHRSDDRSLVTR